MLCHLQVGDPGKPVVEFLSESTQPEATTAVDSANGKYQSKCRKRSVVQPKSDLAKRATCLLLLFVLLRPPMD